MRRSFKNLTWKFWTFFVGIIFTFFVLISTNYFFKARNIEITFFDSNPENLEIQKKLVEILENENKSFLDFIFFKIIAITQSIENNNRDGDKKNSDKNRIDKTPCS